MNGLPYVNEDLFLCAFNLLADYRLIFWAFFSRLIFCVKYNTKGVFTPECTWPKINNGLKSKTVFVSLFFLFLFSLNRPTKEIPSNQLLSERKINMCMLWAGTPGKILSNQAPMSDLIILLKFQLFNHSVCSKNAAIVNPLPTLKKCPGLIIDPADRKQLKRSQTHEGLWDQIRKKKKARSSVGTLGSGLHNCQISWVLKDHTT